MKSSRGAQNDLNGTYNFLFTVTMSSSDDDDNLSDVSADDNYVPFVLPTTNPTMNDFRRVRNLLKFLHLTEFYNVRLSPLVKNVKKRFFGTMRSSEIKSVSSKIN